EPEIVQLEPNYGSSAFSKTKAFLQIDFASRWLIFEPWMNIFFFQFLD
ncbi:22234_t:CDS:1, partial [Gigaspora margarita]